MEAMITIPLHEYERLKERNNYLEGIVDSRSVRITGSQLDVFVDVSSFHNTRKIKGAVLIMTTTIEDARKLRELFDKDWLADKEEYERQFDELRGYINELEFDCLSLKKAAAKRSWFSKLFSRNK